MTTREEEKIDLAKTKQKKTVVANDVHIRSLLELC